MNLSTRTRYGTRVLVNLAASWPDTPLSVHALADRERLSRKYLERIMATLRRARIVSAVPAVGYRLSRDPRRISLAAVVWALEGRSGVGPEEKNCRDCRARRRCVTRRLWKHVDRCLDDCLARISLADLAAPKPRIKVCGRSSALNGGRGPAGSPPEGHAG